MTKILKTLFKTKYQLIFCPDNLLFCFDFFFLAFASAFSHFTAKNEHGRKKPWFIVRESKPKHLYTVNQSYFRMGFTRRRKYSNLDSSEYSY